MGYVIRWRIHGSSQMARCKLGWSRSFYAVHLPSAISQLHTVHHKISIPSSSKDEQNFEIARPKPKTQAVTLCLAHKYGVGNSVQVRVKAGSLCTNRPRPVGLENPGWLKGWLGVWHDVLNFYSIGQSSWSEFCLPWPHECIHLLTNRMRMDVVK